MPRLLLQPTVAPLALFEYWTHHEDLVGFDNDAHAVPVTLTEVIPLVLRYQVKKLPVGVRVTVGTSDGGRRWSVGPASGPEVLLGGSAPDLVRWLSGRRAAGEITMAGPSTAVQELRAFGGRV